MYTLSVLPPLGKGYHPQFKQTSISLPNDGELTNKLVSKHHRMSLDPDFPLFKSINAGRPLHDIWRIQSNINKIEHCKFIIKLWSPSDISPEPCQVCGNLLTYIFGHHLYHLLWNCEHDVWWDPVIKTTAQLWSLFVGPLSFFVRCNEFYPIRYPSSMAALSSSL